jgi:hypothetical protein
MGSPASFVTAASVSDVNTFTQEQTFEGGIAFGVRAFLPFGHSNIAAGDNATPANSTPVSDHWCGVSGLSTASFVAARDGGVVSLSVGLSGNAAGSVAIFGVYKNGVIYNAAAIATIAIGQSKATATFARGLYTFETGDVITVQHRTGSGWTATTVDAAIAVEVEV